MGVVISICGCAEAVLKKAITAKHTEKRARRIATSGSSETGYRQSRCRPKLIREKAEGFPVQSQAFSMGTIQARADGIILYESHSLWSIGG